MFEKAKVKSNTTPVLVQVGLFVGGEATVHPGFEAAAAAAVVAFFIDSGVSGSEIVFQIDRRDEPAVKDGFFDFERLFLEGTHILDMRIVVRIA